MRLALFELGARDVPAIVLVARTPAGDGTLEVPGRRVTAVGAADPATAPEALALHEPAPPAPLLVPTWRPLLRAAWGLGGAALLAAAVAAARRRRARPTPGSAAPPPEELPHLRLARRLDALEADPPPGRALAFALSEAVRAFVAAVAGLPARELTTTELGDRLARAGDPRVDAREVVALLAPLDLVKFADGELGPLDAARAIARARRLGERAGSSTSTAAPTSTSTPTLTRNR